MIHDMKVQMERDTGCRSSALNNQVTEGIADAIGKKKTGSLLRPFVTIMAMALSLAMFFGTMYAQESQVDLSAGGGAPQASGSAEIRMDRAGINGSVEVTNLPPQRYGSGRFYVGWFVRTDTGNKAFLGALVNEGSIVLSGGGEGSMRFSATHFTDGPNAGARVSFGRAGCNLIIVLIEDKINGLSPSPVGPVPGTGVAVAGTF